MTKPSLNKSFNFTTVASGDATTVNISEEM